MTRSGDLRTDGHRPHPKLAALVDAVDAACKQFAKGDPPIRSFHLSGPSKPLPDPPKTPVWFLVADARALARAQARGLLPEIEAALARELETRGNPERELSELVVGLSTIAEHDVRACLERARARSDMPSATRNDSA